jgi:hypothetical protein
MSAITNVSSNSMVASGPAIKKVSPDPMTIVFSFLTGKEIAKISLVQKEWKKLAKNTCSLKAEVAKAKKAAAEEVERKEKISSMLSARSWSNMGEEFY